MLINLAKDTIGIGEGAAGLSKEDIEKRKESSPEDTLLCGNADNKKEWDHA